MYFLLPITFIFVLIHLTILKDGIPFALALACSENPNLLLCGVRPLKERQKSIQSSDRKTRARPLEERPEAIIPSPTSDRKTLSVSKKVNLLETDSIESVPSKVMNSFIYINSHVYVVS